MLPEFLRGGDGASMDDIVTGLKITGHFLQRHVFEPRAMTMPAARAWLAEGWAQRAAA